MTTELITCREKTTRLVVATLDLELLRSLTRDFTTRQCLLLIDENVQRHHPWLISLFEQHYEQVVVATIPCGESSKSVAMYSQLLDVALQAKVRRGTPLFAVGGGVTGDLAGFVAASVLRGLPLFHIPTTLLAMVDSAIGGKTGINHATGKNLIGAFYQPEAVITDVRFLQTLPGREWNCGLGEVIKYACIHSEQIFEEAAAVASGKRGAILAAMIASCASIKADIVMRDELESGDRAFLNYGHTFAHALESHTHYTRFAHGEAVYVGLLAATYFSWKSGSNVHPDRIVHFRDTFRLQTRNLIPDIHQLTAAMFSDKKITGNRLRLVLLSDWGKPYLHETEHLALVEQSWQYALSTATTETVL